MPKFVYDAVDSKGREVKGKVIEAPSMDTVARELKSFGFTVKRIYPASEIHSKVSEVASSFLSIKLETITIFTRQLATLLASGIPLLTSLDALRKNNIDEKLTSILNQVYSSVENGSSLSQAFKEHPRAFDNVYVSMTRAGEISGAMDEIYNRLATLLEKETALKARVQSALTYPAIVLLICIMLCGFIVGYIFPQFVELFDGLDIQLPLLTEFLIHFTNLITEPATAIPIFGIILFLIVGFVLYLRTEVGNRQLCLFLLNFPVIDMFTEKLVTTRLCRMLATLLESGIPLLTAIRISSDAVNNSVIQDQLNYIMEEVKDGNSFSESLSLCPYFPPMFCQMAQVGEETGEISLTLRKLADYYETEIEYEIDSLTSLIEPLLIGIMGFIVGFVLLAIFQPIYQLLGAF